MGINKRHTNKVFQSNLDDWLSSLGFLYPITDAQLERFNKLYKDYDYNLKDAKIDAMAIIKGTYHRKSKIISLITEEGMNESESFDQLNMAARKGQKELPQHIINKMIKKHHNKLKDE